MTTPHPGGFLIPSPPPSSPANSSVLAGFTSLPHPRAHPLKPGGTKESTFIRYVDNQLLHIQRRFAKRTTLSHPSLSATGRADADTWGDVKGYASMKEACKDIDALVSVVWISGTPSLQIPYLLNLGLLVGEVLAGMPPSPKALFRVLGKLDRTFAGLLVGKDVESGEVLPGFERGRGVSGTEKVRVRSLVERTRVGVMEAFKKGEFEEDDGMDVDGDGEDELVLEGELLEEDEDDEESWDMQLARVYDRTVVELGDSLEEPSLGIITEARGFGSTEQRDTTMSS